MDKKEIRGKADRSRINVNEDYELQDWAEKFGVSREDIRRAVKEVGDKALEVEVFLTRKQEQKNQKKAANDKAGII